MKRFRKIIAALVIGALVSSCTTSYDAYGKQRQSVDPAAVAIGAVALGAIAYSAGKSSGKRKERRRHYYDQPNYHHGHYRAPRYQEAPCPSSRYYR